MPTTVKKIKTNDDQEVIVKYAECDNEGNQINTTYVKKTDNISFSQLTGRITDNENLAEALTPINDKLTGSKFASGTDNNKYIQYKDLGQQSPTFVLGFINNNSKAEGITYVSLENLIKAIFPSKPSDAAGSTYVLKLINGVLMWIKEE